jgi:predicted phage terminase large subunit-like protein
MADHRAALTVQTVQDAITKTRAERSLRYYLEHVAWPVIEPQTEFRGGWHIDAMCDHSAALVDNQIRNLLITVPPRHTKSIIASVALPSWAWVKFPELRFLYASFSADLSLEHAVLARRVIASERYQRFWGERYQLTSDQNVKSFYENSRRGYRISSSVGGTVIGRGGDILGLDDPHNLQDIDSDKSRLEVLRFYQHVWSGRFNDPRTGRRLIIMQRGHEEDLAEHIMDTASEAWVHLNLPTEYEPTPFVDLKGNVAILKGSVASEAERVQFETRAALPSDVLVRNEIRVNPLGWKDPRTKEGELLNPDRFGPDEIANAKRDLGPMGYATQHQQRPMPVSGGMFQRDKVRIIRPEDLPKHTPYAECRGWDQASSLPRAGFDPDWTVGAKLRRYATGLYVVMHVVRGQWGPEEGDRVLLTTAQADGATCKVREEQEGGSSGKKVIASHQRLLEAFDYEGAPKTVNKAVYARPFATRWDAGEVHLLLGDWAQNYIDEICLFPHGRHDDQVDASATAFHELASHPVSMLTASQLLAIGGREEDARSATPRRMF